MKWTMRRGWWKPWEWSTRRWVATIVVCILVWPFVLRWFCLWQVPDVALPFDVDEFIGKEEAVTDDAFVYYAKAYGLLRQREAQWTPGPNGPPSFDHAILEVLDKHETRLDDRMTNWLLGSRETLAAFRLGTEMKGAKGPSLRTANYDVLLPQVQSAWGLARLAVAEALRCENAGELDAAWGWHRANLRNARHVAMPPLAILRMTAMAICGMELVPVVQWSSHDALTADQLRRARAEWKAETAALPSQSDVQKVEYLLIVNSMRLPDAPNLLFPKWDTGSSVEPHLLVFKRAALWSVGEPELVQRTLRQLLVNYADEIDNPLHIRRKTLLRTDRVSVIETEPSALRKAGQLDPKRLARVLEGRIEKMFAHVGYITLGKLDTAFLREAAQNVAIEVVLAAQEYRRVKGEFPASLDQLVPDYLDVIPFDPMDATGAPLHYRRDENGEAVVWSVGEDGVDDSADLDDSKRSAKDVGFRIQFGRSSLAKPTDESAEPK